jgi:methyl-accepting chemotaxis protein
MKRSLAFKLVFGGIIIILIPLFMVGIFAITKSSRALEESSKMQSIETAEALTSMVSMVLLEELKIVSDYAIKSEVIDAATKVSKGDAAGAAGEIEKLGNAFSATMKKIGKDYETIVMADANGICFVDGIDGKAKGINVSERDYFKQAKAGKINLGAPSKSKQSGNPIVPVCAPVYSSSGEFVGTISIMLKIDFFLEKIRSIKLGQTGYAFMLDKSGMTIAHPKKEFILTENMTTRDGIKEVAEKMVRQQTGAQTYTFDGVKKVTGYAPVELTGWSIGVTQDYDEIMAPARALRNFILIVGFLFLGATILAVLFLSRRITKPIAETAKELNEAADQVASASGQVSSTSQSLAEGASEQAAGLEETSSSIEEMASMTRQNAENALQSKMMMTEAQQIVDKVNKHMEDMATAIIEITRSSEETGKIIKTIDEIAFQTNLLALNAAVEAARAGEAGAGFAVVADEVRNLAMRASEAAKNTNTLIENTIKAVKNGNELTQATQGAFEENMVISGKISKLIDEIAAASQEQSQGVEQINRAVSEMDKVVQKNAANAEESAAAAEEMNSQAEQMKQFVKELLSIIDGNKNGTTGFKNYLVPSGARKRIPADGPIHLSDRSDFLPRKALKDVKGKATPGKFKEVRPEQLIPLEEDSFKEF